MTTRAACASTNFLTATTWATVDATSFSGSEAAGTGLTTSYQTSTTFTPGAITIDGLAVKLSNRTGTAGTITVALDLATVDVAGTVVTINCSDLPAATSALLDGGWIFFKFAAPVTLAGATAYGVKAKTSNANQVTLFVAATTNFSRYLRTTTTGAPTTGDDLIIAKEWTAAATGTALSVTMDETAATDYGSAPSAALGLVTPGIAICQGGTLAFKDTSAANPYLRLSNSLIIYNGGTLNIGTVATPIPRDSTAILEFDLAADGDYGLIPRNGSIVNIQGLSRTVGKNVVSAKLTVDSSVNLVQTVTLTSSALTQVVATTTVDPTGTSLGVGASASAFNIVIGATDTVANANHKFTWTGASVTNVTQVYTQWIKRGTGTNNRFVRLQLATATTLPATNGFYADFDLQAGTVGTVTALGNGTATSAAITAFGGGFICTIIGKISSGAGSSIACIGACNASTVVSYAGDATQNFICSWPQVYTAASQPTQDTIDTDTGWLSGDVVALASTTRTSNECEVASLSANAGASTLTYNLYPVNARSGSGDVPNTVTLTIASPCVVTGNKDAVNGAKVVLTTTGALPTGLTASTAYYVINKSTDGTHQLAATPGGAAINTSGSQSGVQTATTSCTQAEVILLSRNVKVRSTSPTLMSYVNIKSGAVVDIDWAEFYYIGTSTGGQSGVEVEVQNAVVTNFSMQFSSIHDTEVGGFKLAVPGSAGTLTSAVFSSNTMWNLSTVTGPACQIASTITATGWTFDSNILLRTGSGNGWTLADVGGTFTNNTVVGVASTGVALSEAATLGTMSGNTAHSNAGVGATLTTSLSGTFGTYTAWRNSSFGITINTAVDFILDTPVMFGNTTTNIQVAANTSPDFWVKSPTLNSDTTFPTTININIASTGATKLLVDNGDLSTVSGIKTAATTGDIAINGSPSGAQVVLRNTKLGASVEVLTPSGLSNNGFIASEKNDQTAGNHMTWMKNGKVQTDSTIFNTASPSMRMTPTSATLKLESEPQFQGMKVAVANGATVTPGIYVRKSVVGDGVAYNGNQPRLILKANPAIGISADVVIATAAAAAGSWEQLTGTTAAATDDGVMEFVIDADGTAGWINVDDRSAA